MSRRDMNVPKAFIFPNRWQYCVESLGIETTSCSRREYVKKFRVYAKLVHFRKTWQTLVS